jgi:hypothetical protein
MQFMLPFFSKETPVFCSQMPPDPCLSVHLSGLLVTYSSVTCPELWVSPSLVTFAPSLAIVSLHD